MKKLFAVALTSALVVCLQSTFASGPLGIYGIVDKVVFEPNEQSPERIQVWGAFSFFEDAREGLKVSPAKRGYLYFSLPTTSANSSMTKKEWSDLKAIAGTGQTVGFGGFQTERRVRPPSESPQMPVPYTLNTGFVKLDAHGSHAELVTQLKNAK
jgi:hypothetical protein